LSCARACSKVYVVRDPLVVLTTRVKAVVSSAIGRRASRSRPPFFADEGSGACSPSTRSLDPGRSLPANAPQDLVAFLAMAILCSIGAAHTGESRLALSRASLTPINPGPFFTWLASQDRPCRSRSLGGPPGPRDMPLRRGTARSTKTKTVAASSRSGLVQVHRLDLPALPLQGFLKFSP
jgi:hypothetical protein